MLGVDLLCSTSEIYNNANVFLKPTLSGLQVAMRRQLICLKERVHFRACLCTSQCVNYASTGIVSDLSTASRLKKWLGNPALLRFVRYAEHVKALPHFWPGSCEVLRTD